jgi:hypothetical protein
MQTRLPVFGSLFHNHPFSGIEINYLAFAIPAFFLFIYIEYRVSAMQNKGDRFQFESSIANVSIGIAERLVDLFVAASFYAVFVWVYTQLRPLFYLYRLVGVGGIDPGYRPGGTGTTAWGMR